MKISIVTVTYNAFDKLEKTIESVLGQTRQPDEYIIVDGGSKDGTVELIKKYESLLTRWISEPDSGIYNAMNKAVSLTTGDWILFMNAEDTFVSNDVLEKFVYYLSENHKNQMLAYGDCHIILPNGKVVFDKALEPSKIFNRMICSHQSLFARRSLLIKYPFEEKYRVCADHHFLLRTIFDKIELIKLPFAVGKVQLEHYTWKQIRNGHWEKWRSVRSVKKSLSIDFYFIIRFFRLALGSFFKFIKSKI